MKKLLCLLSFVLCSLSVVRAQYFREDGYSYYYDYDHRVVVRSYVECTDDHQDLWNGDYVRLINNTVYIYRGQSRVTYGDRIWLEHTGDYTVQRGGTMYLYDSDGDYTGVYGNTVNMLWNGICSVRRGDYWYLYTRGNRRLGSVYSTEHFSLYWNGYYCYSLPNGYYYVADEDGDQMPNSYSDEEPTLTNSGYFNVVRNGNHFTIDTRGQRVY